MKEKSIEELIIQSEKKERKSKRRILLLTLIPIIAGLVFTAYTFNKSQKADIIITENETLKESTKVLSNYRDSLEQIELKKIGVGKTIKAYFHYDSIQSADSIQMLLSDTLNRYYLIKQIPREEVRVRQEKHWQKYPKEQTMIKDKPDIRIENDSLIIVFVNLDYSKKGEKSSDILTEFRLNSNNKITVIRAFKDVPESYVGVYFDE